MTADDLKYFHHRKGDCHAHRTAEASEHEIFCRNLPKKLDATDAHRAPDCVFLLPLQTAHQEKRGDIAARNQQNHPDGCQENPEDVFDVADHVIRQWTYVRFQLQPRSIRRPDIAAEVQPAAAPILRLVSKRSESSRAGARLGSRQIVVTSAT